HSKQSGSTLLATLREVYSGSDLGAQYATADKRRPVRAHCYRAALVAGIQPARSGVLLDDAAGGTPQRWLWLPTTDPGWTPAAVTTGGFTAPATAMWTPGNALVSIGEIE